VTTVLFLLGQLFANIVVLAKLNTRITRVETHLIHLMQNQQLKLWAKEMPEGYKEDAG
jgi:hypothetical protein